MVVVIVVVVLHSLLAAEAHQQQHQHAASSESCSNCGMSGSKSNKNRGGINNDISGISSNTRSNLCPSSRADQMTLYTFVMLCVAAAYAVARTAAPTCGCCQSCDGLAGACCGALPRAGDTKTIVGTAAGTELVVGTGSSMSKETEAGKALYCPLIAVVDHAALASCRCRCCLCV